jgi:hypothetical protein
MTLAITLLFTVNLFLKLQKEQKDSLAAARRRNGK